MLEAIKMIKENGGKKTLIIYDTDGDGIGSAAILTKFFRKVFKKTPSSMPSEHESFFISEKMLKEIKRKNFDFIITVDIAIDERLECILELSKKARILVVDHHQIHNDLNKYKNIVHVNPSLCKIKIPPYKYCVSKIIFDICSEITNIEDLDWLTGIGIVNDKCEDVWKDFLENIYKKYSFTYKKLKTVNDIITAGYNYCGNSGVKIGYDACLEASSPIDILKAKTPNSKKLKRFYNIIEREIISITKNWKKKAEIIEDKKLIMLQLKTKFSISSPISTIISLEKPNYTIFVSRKRDDMIYISLRRQDGKVDCGEIASSLTKNLENSSGGGHRPAAGIHIMSRDWNIFKERILDLL